MRGRVSVGVLIAATIVAGCGTGAVDGQAEAAGVDAGEPAFSPCDDIPDDVIVELGLDPATETRDILGVAQPGWNICDWQGERHGITAYSTRHTQEEFRANPAFEDFFEVDVPGRTAFGHREVNDTRRISCDVAVDTETGVVAVSAGLHVAADTGDSQEACGIALDAMLSIVRLIPE